MSKFQREDRYIVIKRSDITAEQLAAIPDVPTRDCVAVERDWPEYEPVWAMLEARCQPPAMTASSDLVARLRESEEMFRENPVYNSEGDGVLLTIHADIDGEAAARIENLEAAIAAWNTRAPSREVISLRAEAGRMRRALVEAGVSLNAIGHPQPNDPADGKVCGTLARSCLIRIDEALSPIASYGEDA